MGKKNKEQSELKRQIKEMEKEARIQAMVEAAAVEQPASEEPSKISFDQWWMIAQGRQKIRPHLKEVIWADMQARGLSKEESQLKYDEALRLFGYSW